MCDNYNSYCLIYPGLPLLSVLGSVDHTIRIISKADCNLLRAFVSDTCWRKLKKKKQRNKALGDYQNKLIIAENPNPIKFQLYN